jgi:hypothetical protein
VAKRKHAPPKPRRKAAPPKKAPRRAPSKKVDAKRRPKKAKKQDWSKKRAPKPGAKSRADYERSPVYRARVRAAKKGLVTRRKHEAAEQRRLERWERREVGKEKLRPLLAKMVSDYKRGDLVGGHGHGMREAKEAHANWYAAKMNLADFMPERDYARMLDELSLEADLDELGWDIVY